MKKTKNKKQKLIQSGIAVSVVCAVFWFFFKNDFAMSGDCDFLVGEAKDTCFIEKCKPYIQDPESVSSDCVQLTDDQKRKECEKRSEDMVRNCKLIDLKNKQQTTLQKQIEIIDTEQERNRQQIESTQKKLITLEEETGKLEREIEGKESSIKYQKAMLSGLMQAYYERHQEGTLKIVLLNSNFSNILSQADYLNHSSEKMSESLYALQEIRSDLQVKQDDLAQKKEEHEKLQEELEDKKSSLQDNEAKKQSLLVQTQGEETKYQQLLARVEAQKLELFDFGTASNLDDVIKSVDSYKKPDKKYWDSNNFYLQWDSRWGNKKIGGTKYLMKDFGCAVTSVAMAYQFDGKNYTPQTVLSSAGFTSQALIFWPSGWLRSSFNSSIIDSKLKSGEVVIAHIKKGSTAGHFVVIHHKPTDFKSIDDYVVHDPYFGANLYLGTSRSLVGKLGTNGSTSMDIMVTY